MPNGKTRKSTSDQPLPPLGETVQLGTRVYQALLHSIVTGQMELGAPLRPDAIAEQLQVSTTPVREAIHRLEIDGVAIKLPYQGWFVREFTENQIRELYEFRSGLEQLGVRLACQRITKSEIQWLHKHQATGQAALKAKDMEAYRIYNRDFHSAVFQAAKNSYLSSAVQQVALQSDMLTSKTIRIVGRPLRAIEEHQQLIELVERGQEDKAEKLMESHIVSALEDIIQYHFASGDTSEPEKKASKRARSA